MSFWDHMKLWEKMLLVLAVGMFLTLLAGCLKLIYNNYRVKKHTKIAEARKSHIESIGGGTDLVKSKQDEIPFGIKALEAGVEVEGIYISRPNTPARYTQSQATLVGSDAASQKSRGQGPPSPRFAHGNGSGSSSPAPSMKSGRPMVYQPSPYVQLPPASYAGMSSVRSSASSLNGTPPITRHSSTERVQQNHRPYSENGQDWQGKSIPTIPDADTLAKLEGRQSSGYDYSKSGKRGSSRTPSPPESQVSPSLPSVDEDGPSEESSRESDSSLERRQHPRYSRPGGLLATYSSPSLPSALNRPVSETTQGDLSALHSHRLSHAAEVGQLLPRKRQSNNPGSVTPTGEVSQPFYSQATSDPVYALDISIPKGGLDGLHYPQLPSMDSLPTRKDTPFDSDSNWLPGSEQGEQVLSSSDSSPERKPIKGKGKNLLKKGKGKDVDLEAQS